MKTKLLFAISFLWGITGFGQFGPQQIISTDTKSPVLSIPYDVDNDGYIDIITNSEITFKLTWYRNLDGQGNFGPKIILNENTANYESIDFVDLDNDGKEDIVYLKTNPQQVAWLKNLDNHGNYAEEQALLTAGGIMQAKLLDVDEDGKLDLVIILQHMFESSVVWYKNLGNGDFDVGQTIWDYDTYLSHLMIVDVDNDGKPDLVIVDDDYLPASIFWHKNLGNQNFGPPETIFQFDLLLSHFTDILDIQLADINNDGKDDFVFSSFREPYDFNIYWLENIDNQGHYDNLRLIHEGWNDFALYDLNNNGNLDLIFWHKTANILSWKEHEDGLGNFGPAKTISREVDKPSDVRAADIDGDGWLDILSASVQDNKLAWYKNNILDISKNNADKFILYPNPTDGLLTIESKQEISKISVFNTLGQTVGTFLNSNQINLSKTAAGIYFVEIENSVGNFQRYRIIKK